MELANYVSVFDILTSSELFDIFDDDEEEENEYDLYD